MMPRLGLAVPLANLAFNFFGDLVYGGIEIRVTIFGEEIWSAHAESHGAGERFFRDALVVVFQDDPGVYGALVEMIELFNFGNQMIFDGLGERHTVRNQNQFHERMVLRANAKIQSKVPLGFRAQRRAYGAQKPRRYSASPSLMRMRSFFGCHPSRPGSV